MNLPSAATCILIAHWVIVVGLSTRVILRRPPVGVSMAWLAVVFSVPFVGAIVYLLFGEKRLERGRVARSLANDSAVDAWRRALETKFCATHAAIGVFAEPIATLATRALGYPPLPGNALELLHEFGATTRSLVADIDAARVSCHLSFYAWDSAGRAQELIDALIRAARRGVECKALADALGSKPFFASEQLAQLRTAGVAFCVALPTGPLRALTARVDLRNHRKLVVIDGRIAYAGSQNLVDPHYFKQGSGVGEWVDAMVRVTGPAVAALACVFLLDWAVETREPFTPPAAPDLDPLAPAGAVIQAAPSGPDSRPEAIQRLLLTAIYSARRELLLTSPYFVPDESILTALLSAAQRGVEVTLIVPARNDSLLVRHASAATYDDLLTAGARIALFNGGLLHTKSLTIDGTTSVFGSVNLDMRSLWLNFELSLFVYDAAFTAQLRALQTSYLANSQRLDRSVWRQRPAWRRIAEDTCRLLGPLL